MKGQAILTFLVEEDKRLEQPPRCPDGVYTVMLECWQFEYVFFLFLYTPK